jgi:enamine deaminase RidA (YjgF/YER057c/UK114 family)
MALPSLPAPAREPPLALEAGPIGGALRAGGLRMVVLYGAAPAPRGSRRLGVPVVRVPQPVLGSGGSTEARPWIEAWRSPGANVECGESDGIVWSEDGRVHCGTLTRRLGAEELGVASRAHFTAILDHLESRGYPRLWRIWNYLPRINEVERGLERYRSFNVGRAAAFAARYGASAAARFSASSAVGADGEELVTCWIAGRQAGRHLENPRQLRAYRYPERYGPQPPSFARATLAPHGSEATFFLSGTASIVGHESRHPRSAVAQLAETWQNVEAVGALAGVDPAELDFLKVYVRRRSDFERIRRAVARRVGAATAVLFLLADICRSELRLEIEGVATHRG